MTRLIITIDGPTGSGKTATAKMLSQRLNIFHLKGGIFLRSLTYFCLRNNITTENDIAKTSRHFNPVIDFNNENNIFLDEENVADFLWTKEVNAFVPFVANIREVRSERKKWIREITKNMDIVADGRTLGSEIFPDATIKFFLTCGIKERAQRRLLQKRFGTDLDGVKEDILKRDKKDMEGVVNRLLPPKNSIHIDSTHLTLEQTVSAMLNHITSFLSETSQTPITELSEWWNHHPAE
ncbi:(d)CMP kinase [Desulfosarcina sp. OttesenSCG-928-A07]|nr:(d)CMP kinase [Desulfosarcina sp. OttesenSCG-928-A07]